MEPGKCKSSSVQTRQRSVLVISLFSMTCLLVGCNGGTWGVGRWYRGYDPVQFSNQITTIRLYSCTAESYRKNGNRHHPEVTKSIIDILTDKGYKVETCGRCFTWSSSRSSSDILLKYWKNDDATPNSHTAYMLFISDIWNQSGSYTSSSWDEVGRVYSNGREVAHIEQRRDTHRTREFTKYDFFCYLWVPEQKCPVYFGTADGENPVKVYQVAEVVGNIPKRKTK